MEEPTADDLSLEVFDPTDYPSGTAELLGAVWYLRRHDRRSRRGAIADRVPALDRDAVVYRTNLLVDDGLLDQSSYQEHNQVVHEFVFGDEAAARDGETCYRGLKILDDGEIEDPSRGTMIALAGRLGGLEADIDDIKDELGISEELSEIEKKYVRT